MKKLLAILVLFVGCLTLLQAQTPKEKGQVIQMDKQMFLDKVFDYTTGATEWSYKGDKPAVIDFYATWCGACGAIDDALDRVALTMGDAVTLVRIDTTTRSSFDLVRRYNVVALPTLMLFSRGRVLWRECGLITFERLAGIVRRFHSAQLF
mgnify:CR=1 FL=1